MAETTDSYDIDIIRELWDGRKPYGDVARKVGLTTNTVRARVKRMLESGILQIIALVNPNAIERHSAAYIGFKLSPGDWPGAVKTIASLKGVVGVSSVTGRFDAIAIVMFNEKHSYQKFLTDEINKIQGLVSTETFFVIEGDTFQLRYVL